MHQLKHVNTLIKNISSSVSGARKNTLQQIREAVESLNLPITWSGHRILLEGKPITLRDMWMIRESLENDKGIRLSRSELHEALLCIANAQQTLREDPSLPAFEALSSLAGDEVTMATCLQVLDIPDERVHRAVEIRIGHVMKRLGWIKTRTLIDGRRSYVYRKTLF